MKLTLEEMLDQAALDVEMAAGADAKDEDLDTEPLWQPLPLQPGRPGIQIGTRVLSPQQAAYESLADELLFGGGGGSGKSDLLLGLATTKHRNSIIFRPEFTQHQGIIDRSKEIIGLRGDFGDKVWRNLPGGRKLEFGAARTMKDAWKYLGRPHDLKEFDELPQFAENVYRTLIGWLRTPHEGQRTRVVSTGNPPMTAEGLWVISYWGPWLDPKHPHPAKPGELRWYAVVDGKDVERPDRKPFLHGGDRIVPRSRTFIPALVEDNPYYMRTGYDQVLNNLPEPLRSQVRRGDFTVGIRDDEWQVIPTAWVQAAMDRWRPDGHLGRSVTAAGNDPSRGGNDEFVIAKRYDNWVAPLLAYPATSAPDGQRGAQLVYKALGGDKTIPVQIDIIGSAGSSVYDQCRDLGLRAVEMNASEKSEKRDRSGKLGFVNQRAEWHWTMRELLDPVSRQDIALPPDPQMKADLCSARWHATPRGIQVEAKEDIKARIGRSPDRGEAVIYCVVQKTLPQTPKKPRGGTWGR